MKISLSFCSSFDPQVQLKVFASSSLIFIFFCSLFIKNYSTHLKIFIQEYFGFLSLYWQKAYCYWVKQGTSKQGKNHLKEQFGCKKKDTISKLSSSGWNNETQKSKSKCHFTCKWSHFFYIHFLFCFHLLDSLPFQMRFDERLVMNEWIWMSQWKFNC